MESQELPNYSYKPPFYHFQGFNKHKEKNVSIILKYDHKPQTLTSAPKPIKHTFGIPVTT